MPSMVRAWLSEGAAVEAVKTGASGGLVTEPACGFVHQFVKGFSSNRIGAQKALLQIAYPGVRQQWCDTTASGSKRQRSHSRTLRGEQVLGQV